MNNKTIILILTMLVLYFLPVRSQDSVVVSLFECYKLVRENSPRNNSFDLIEKETGLEQKKINNTNLPQVSAYGKAWYQSDAMAVAFPIPGVQGIEVDKFQYNAAVNVDQKLFDGGMSGVQRELFELQGDIKSFESEVGLYQLNNVVNKYFFGILSLNQSVKIVELKIESLSERKKILESGVRNGMILKSELQRIEAEIYSSEQQITELRMGIVKLEAGLKELAGIEKVKTVKWIVLEQANETDTINRTELKLFEANRSYLNAMQQLQNKRYVPKFAAYGQLGYSYPGLNLFENEPTPFYIVGVKMSWNIWDWKHANTQKQIIEINKDRIQIQEEDFQKNLSISLNSERTEMEKLEELIAKDEIIINTKEAITKSSASALDNGTITSAEYLSDLNSELYARFNSEQHKISLMEARVKLAVLLGVDVN